MRSRAWVASLLAGALLCCAVLTARRTFAPVASVALDEATALRLAGAGFPPAPAQTRLAAAEDELAQVRTGQGAKQIRWPGLADFERHEARLGLLETAPRHELLAQRPPKGSVTSRIHWPGIKAFEKHEAMLAAAPSDAAPRDGHLWERKDSHGYEAMEALRKAADEEGLTKFIPALGRSPTAAAKQSDLVVSRQLLASAPLVTLPQTVPRTDTPSCPCRGGCPCPAHGHGDNARTVEEEGMREGMAMGFKMGVEAAEHALSAQSRPVMLTGKAEDKYIEGIEKRFATEDADEQWARKAPAARTGKRAAGTGKTTQPTSSANLPWAFKRELPAPDNPDFDTGEFQNPMPVPGEPGAGKGAGARARQNSVAVQEARVLKDLTRTANMRKAAAARAASHDSEIAVITQPGDPHGFYTGDKKAAAQQHLAEKKAAEAAHSTDVSAIMTRDFDTHARALAQLRDSRHPGADSWMSRVIAAVNAGKHAPMSRTIQQRERDTDWKARTEKAHKLLASAEQDITRGYDAGRALATKAARSPLEKAVAREAEKDAADAKIARELKEIAKADDGATPSRPTQLADFSVQSVAKSVHGSAGARAGAGLHEADARALGFQGLAGLEAHVKSFKAWPGEGHALPPATQGVTSAVAVGPGWRHRRVRVQALGVRRGHVRQDVRPLGQGSPPMELSQDDKENAAVRAAVKQAAQKKAAAVGRATAVALGFSGVRQFAAHLDREALGLGQ